MSDLFIIAFDDKDAAFAMHNHLGALRAEQRLETQDTTIVTRDGEGTPTMHRPLNVPLAQTLGGTIWGLVLGAAFVAPVAGAAVGAATGALLGRNRDPGVDSGFLERIAESLPPGGSALCLLVRDLDHDAVMQTIADFPKRGTLIQSPMDDAEEARLRALVNSEPTE
ncbi:DUF1269 domain-containing protein [Roseovarius sp. MMSF_3281]|uniref:DUF1269 domain-containing protein n=1 Tax=Roseovarius sp. MMSF_3281 TaxID=3046694 RepID=UPI00273DEE92|nr:DUF1269 domain-containing protein [Roseovarius sp. MMSF_3281]